MLFKLFGRRTAVNVTEVVKPFKSTETIFVLNSLHLAVVVYNGLHQKPYFIYVHPGFSVVYTFYAMITKYLVKTVAGFSLGLSDVFFFIFFCKNRFYSRIQWKVRTYKKRLTHKSLK